MANLIPVGAGKSFKSYNQVKPWKKYQKSPHRCWCGQRFEDLILLSQHKFLHKHKPRNEVVAL